MDVYTFFSSISLCVNEEFRGEILNRKRQYLFYLCDTRGGIDKILRKNKIQQFAAYVKIKSTSCTYLHAITKISPVYVLATNLEGNKFQLGKQDDPPTQHYYDSEPV